MENVDYTLNLDELDKSLEDVTLQENVALKKRVEEMEKLLEILEQALAKEKLERKSFAQFLFSSLDDDVISKSVAEEVEAYFTNEFDIIAEVNEGFNNGSIDVPELNFHDHEDDWRDFVNELLRQAEIKISL